MNLYKKIDFADLSTDVAAQKIYLRPADSTFLQFGWSGVTGTANGVFTVNAVTAIGKSLIGTVTVDSATNAADVDSLTINAPVEAIEISYVANDITAGVGEAGIHRNKD